MTATAVATQESQLQRWREELEEASRETRRLTEGLTEAQLRWRPSDREWSVAQIFQHLARANESYLSGMRRAVEQGRRAEPGAGKPWRPSLVGGLIIRSLEPTSTRKLPAPRIWHPVPEARQDAVEQFLRTHDELVALTWEVEGVDLVRSRTHSPVSRLIRVNLGDCFATLVVHARRHLDQVRRLVERPGFPAA